MPSNWIALGDDRGLLVHTGFDILAWVGGKPRAHGNRRLYSLHGREEPASGWKHRPELNGPAGALPDAAVAGGHERRAMLERRGMSDPADDSISDPVRAKAQSPGGQNAASSVAYGILSAVFVLIGTVVMIPAMAAFSVFVREAGPLRSPTETFYSGVSGLLIGAVLVFVATWSTWRRRLGATTVAMFVAWGFAEAVTASLAHWCVKCWIDGFDGVVVYPGVSVLAVAIGCLGIVMIWRG